jgi:hypothetical protein
LRSIPSRICSAEVETEMPATTALTKISPTLAAFAVPRTGDAEMVGRYCHERDVWIVDGKEGPRPIVELRTDIAETATFTKVLAEQDDTDVSPTLEAATHTSTAVRAEADDQDRDSLANTLLMVTTKTEANVERDDVVKTLLAFELQSSSGVPVGGIRIH